MKFFKKVTATLIAVSMTLAMTVTSFAWSNVSGYYTIAVKAEDAEGTEQTTFAPGSDVYFAFYLYETANPSATEDIDPNDAASHKSGLSLNAAAIASSYAEYGFSNPLNLDSSLGGKNELYVYGGQAYITAQPSAADGFTVSNTTPFVRYKVTLGDTEMDDVVVTCTAGSASSGTLVAKGVKKVGCTFSIKKADVSEKPVNGDVIGTTSGKKIYFANTVTGTFNKNTGFKVKYTGSDPAYTGKYKDNCKDIKATLGDLLGGEISDGDVNGNLHFGIVLKDTSAEADKIPGFQVEATTTK